jgi:WD40 repeat protein
MPPKSPKIPDAEIAIIKGWIEQGLIEVEGGKSKAPAFRSLEFKATPNNVAGGPVPMPENLPALNLPKLAHANAVTALAASPRAPLLAVAGQERIVLYDTAKRATIGVLPFPEGIPHVLRFSRNGTVLLAAGGRGVKLGKAVLYDVKTGNRLADFGDETDIVLAADISPDQKLVAIGGPTKIVKVFSTKDGKLVYKIVKHTDWVTALEFSPDGQKLATGDRNGSAFLWEAETGGVLYALSEHKDGINSMSWRADSEVLATGGEDGQLVVWDAKEGWPVNQVTPHVPKPKGTSLAKLPNGVLSVMFASDGKLYSTGRDNALRAWQSGGGKVGAYESVAGIVTRLTVSADGKNVYAGDLRGNVWVWDAPTGTKVEPLVATK